MNLVIVFLYVLLSIWQSFRSEGGGYSNSVALTCPAVFQHSATVSVQLSVAVSRLQLFGKANVVGKKVKN